MSEIMSGISLLISFLCLIFLAWKFFHERETRKALFVILIIGLVLRIIAVSDPYLHNWDERYHALVAKNMVDHPLKPTLHEHPILETDNENWVGGNIWLAKPVFPLLLMSGSIATFGANLFAVRFVSIILGLLAVWLTFLIGKRLFDERVALVAAFLHAIHGNLIELVGGRISSDHVELCFVVMVELGVLFALNRFNRHGKDWSIFLAGLFMGLAFLSKWYPALIVIPIWATFFYTYFGLNWKRFFAQLGLLILGFILITFPWIFYMFKSFPIEIKNVLTGVASAYSEVVQDHGKPFYYYFKELMLNFGELFYIPLVFFIYQFWTKKSKFRYAAILIWIAIPVLIFSLGETKRYTYLLISAPAIFIIIAWFFVRLADRKLILPNKFLKWVLMICLIGLPIRYTVERVKFFKTDVEKAAFYNYTPNELNLIDNKTIVFGSDDYIEILFHTDAYAAYRELPESKELERFKSEGFTVLIAQNGRLVPF